MNRTLKWRIPLIAAVVCLALMVVYPPFDPDGAGPLDGKLKLGLDLQGGMHLVLRVKTETLPKEAQEDATERALEIIRNRIDQFGVSEPLIQRQGKDQLIIQLPGVADRKRALDLIGRTALLEFKLVSSKPMPSDDATQLAAEGLSIQKHENGSKVLLESKTLLEGKRLVDASVQYSNQWNEPVVAISFDSVGAKTFGEITSASVGRQLAIVLDGVVQSSPVINEPILSGDAQITGSFSYQEAHDLAIALRAGALPAPIEIQEERTVGPTLGRDSIVQGIRAMYLAGLLVVVFMAVYYLFAGLVADLALALNILLIGAALAYFKGTLTLPGIAGVILTIGMAVDTNVLILERVREELRVGKSVQAAIAAGYKKAFSAILDSNVTTFLTALVLFRFGTGPVRGYALTLAIGIVGSFFSGIFVTRAILELFLTMRPAKGLPMLSFLKKVPHLPFMKAARILTSLSVILVGAGLAVVLTQAPSHLGVDFTGGTVQEYRFAETVDVAAVRTALETVGLGTATIQQYGSKFDFVIRTPQGTTDQVDSALATAFKNVPHERLSIEEVGPVIGAALRKKAFYAIMGSLLIILIYLAFRFELRYSVGTIAALFHDAVICLALVILTGREITIPVLAAILTTVGYSANDTIVIFDRVRENVRRGLRIPFSGIVDQSINESLSRTLLTSVTTLLVVVALYFLGGPVINDFAFVMIVGVVAGTYSTVYVSCPVVTAWPARKRLR
ncbi:MAG: protein translocase subunit SecD [Candidatus Omnitrophica bacterium]|nr:protein translocase subunit SecD [Candidatus Omnitrophota bacterium]